MAPYDVRQGHFVGAGVNMVTRSGANQFRGSALLVDPRQRSRRHRGEGARPSTRARSTTTATAAGRRARSSRTGCSSSAATRTTSSRSRERRSAPTRAARRWRGNVTRVLASDLDALSAYLKTNFGYDTGPYEDYPFETPAKRYLAKLDYNFNNRNKVSVRYLQLDSQTPVLVSNSSSLGAGSRRSSTIGPQLRELQLRDPREHQVGRRRVELDPGLQHGQQPDRRLHQERREPAAERIAVPVRGHPRGDERLHVVRLRALYAREPAPLPHVPDAGQLHLEPLAATRSPSAGPSSATTPTTCSSRDPRASTSTTRSPTSTPTRTTTWRTRTGRLRPSRSRSSRSRWNNIPGQTEPLQPLDVWYGGVYAQDEWQASHNLKITYGLRVDVLVLRRHRLPRTRTPTPSRSATRAATRSSTRRGSCRTPSCSGRRASASTGT